ncbi:MAG TPA: hypothetical protein DDX92_13690 [Flavobacteriales bacterium]|jgi:deoxyguanosine kinase|nr:hypothetical protein [Flavobacteriales bacterium]
MYIVIEGIIGAGKSTIAQNLARRLNATYYSEEFETNPCLKKFYSNPIRYARCTEDFFLNQRYEDLQRISKILKGGGKVIADFGFFKGMAFGMVNLSSADYHDFKKNYDRLIQTLPKAGFTIFLDADPEWAIQNIVKRNRLMEQNIELDYLISLTRSYRHIIDRSDVSTVYKVSSEDFYFLSIEQLAEKLEAEIKLRFP